MQMALPAALERLDSGTRAAWNAMARHPFSRTGFIEAYQNHAPAELGTGVVTHREAGRLAAGAPVFTWLFKVETVLGAGLKPIGNFLARMAPKYVHVPILGIGSAVSDRCGIVIDPALDAAGRRRAIDDLVSQVMAKADALDSHLIVFKDLSQELAEESHEILTRHGFSRLASMPRAVIDLPFTDMEGYFGSLDGKLRSELRRKMRQSRQVEVKLAGDDFAQAAPTVDRLIAETWQRRKMDFEAFDQLTPGFAAAFVDGTKGAGKCSLTWLDGQIVGCNLFLDDPDDQAAIAFLIGLSGEHVREHNLYFINWLWMVRYCIEHGRKRLDVGQSNYGLKMRLGCRLEPSWIYVRHRRPGWNRVVKAVVRRVSLPRLDPDLKAANVA